MPSAEHESFVEMMRGGLGLEALSIVEQRAMMEASASMSSLAPDLQLQEVDADGVAADLVGVAGAETDRVILYFHGGAYSMGSRNTHRALAANLARAAQAQVLVAEYRLAPEHPFPAAVEDAMACWRWLLAQGYSPERAAIAGDSAGGGLAMATLLAIKAADAPTPACAIGMSPWLDLCVTGPTAESGAVDDPMLTSEGLRTSSRLYAGDAAADPLASPLYGELAGLPPLLLQVGTREVLLSDSTRFANKARTEGVPVTLEVEDGLVHVWQMLPGVPEAARSIARIGEFVRDHA